MSNMEFDEEIFRLKGPKTAFFVVSDAEKADAVIGQAYKPNQIAIAMELKGIRTCGQRSAKACKLCIETGWNLTKKCEAPMES